MKTSESTINIRKARIAAKKMMQKPRKDAINPHFNSRYSSFEEIIRVVENAFLPNDLDLDFEIVKNGEEIGARVIITHAPSGEFLEYEPLFMHVTKNTPQGYGSIITYVKRYALCAALALASTDIDDDANMATEEVLEEEPHKRQQTGVSNKPSFELKRKHKGFMAWCRNNNISDVVRREVTLQETGKDSSKDLTVDEMHQVYHVLNSMLQKANSGG